MHAPLDRAFSARRISRLATLAVAALAIYGSLIPFDLTPPTSSSAVAWLARVGWHPWSDVSWADLLVNVSVGVSLGLCGMGTLTGDRPGSPRFVARTLLVVVCGVAAMATMLELLQLFSA